MSNNPVVRRLAAIVAADVVGYSRLMEADEVGTLAALKALRRDFVDPTVVAHHGRLVKTTGDGLLLEFASVVDAIACAVAVQRGMLSRNAAMPEKKRIVLRVGINIGDIIIDGTDIFGDGVNVAARLEALCDPGGICISREANEQVRDKLHLSFADLGEHAVKNISRAVGVFGLRAQDIAALPETALSESSSAAATTGLARFRAKTIAAVCAAIGLLALAGALWLNRTWLASTTLDASGDLRTDVRAVLAKAIPKMSRPSFDQEAEDFVKSKPYRALVIAPRAQRPWRTAGWPSPEVAEEKALEKCQQFFDEACAPIASSDKVIAPGADGTFPVRDAPRVRYTGVFNPERIPGIRRDVAERMDVAGYLTAASPKASAYHAIGILHVVVAAPNQRAAEEQALRACNDDPARKIGAGGPCYLYSSDNRVVLPLRATGAITSAPLNTVGPQASGSPLADPLLAALAKVAPAYSNREQQVRQYLESNPHKALAAFPPSGSWRTRGWESANAAEERVLEACQVRHGGPCALLAVDDAPRASGADATWPQRAMPRASYEGQFDPAQIPAVNQALRQRPDIAGYRQALAPKAAAFHPLGRLFVVTAAGSQRDAEERALQNCNSDPDRAGRDGPCLLYAVANQVVLPKRFTTVMTTD